MVLILVLALFMIFTSCHPHSKTKDTQIKYIQHDTPSSSLEKKKDLKTAHPIYGPMIIFHPKIQATKKKNTDWQCGLNQVG